MLMFLIFFPDFIKCESESTFLSRTPPHIIVAIVITFLLLLLLTWKILQLSKVFRFSLDSFKKDNQNIINEQSTDYNQIQRNTSKIANYPKIRIDNSFDIETTRHFYFKLKNDKSIKIKRLDDK